MSFLCWFAPCRWVYMCNVERWFMSTNDVRLCGLYQCSRCQTLSIGSAKPFEAEKAAREAALSPPR